MGVRLVILDCDRTLWDHHNVTELHPPFARVDGETVIDARGVPVRLLPGARELLDELRRRGILVSIASWNEPEPVIAILRALELDGYFTRPKIEFHPYKEKMIRALLQELHADGFRLSPADVLYVDDRRVHLNRVRRTVGPIRTLQAGCEIADLREVVRYLEPS